MVVQQFLVLVEQRLALGGVDDEERDLGAELDRRGKTAAARADDAQFFKRGRCVDDGLAARCS